MKSSLTLFLINPPSLPWDSLTPGIGPHAGSLTSVLTLLLSLWESGWPRGIWVAEGGPGSQFCLGHLMGQGDSASARAEERP